MIINGEAIAEDVLAELRASGKTFSGKKVLGILVGSNPAALKFLAKKKRTAKALGIEFGIWKIPATISADKLVAQVEKLADDPAVSGAIVQLPIPVEGVDTQAVLNVVPYEKDIDCLGDRRAEEFYKNPAISPIAPPAVGAVRRILEGIGVADVRGKRMTVYGFGRLVGKPVAAWGAAAGAMVTVLRRSSAPEKIAEALGDADIIVIGAGKLNIIPAESVRPGSVVIDFGPPAGIDAKAADARGVFVTPTPGGTGPVLVAELFRNLYAMQ